jgi:hypothetical protein
VHAAVAVCVTVNVFPAMVSVPLRLAPDEFVPTMNVAVPFPLPGPALMNETHVRLLTAVHAQVDAAVTVLLPEPPLDVNERLVGEIEVVHVPLPVWVTVKVAPAIVSVPLRLPVPVFAATLKPTLPEPEPDAPLVTVIHVALLAALHAQMLPAVTVLLPVPPSPPNASVVGEML